MAFKIVAVRVKCDPRARDKFENLCSDALDISMKIEQTYFNVHMQLVVGYIQNFLGLQIANNLLILSFVVFIYHL